jgi:MipA family protein
MRFPLCSLLLVSACHAAEAPRDETESLGDTRWVLGASLNEGPIYFGQRQRAAGVKTLFALRWRKLRISNSGAGGLLGDSVAGGASADVFQSRDWRVRLGLRIDRGRRIEDDGEGRLQDLERVRGTLRARLAVSHSAGEWGSWTFTAAPDLLDRDGGLLMQLGWYRRLPMLDEALPQLGGQWSLSAQLAGGDARYMVSYFGVPQGARRLSPYRPGAGLRNASLGLGWQRSFGAGDAWVLFGGTQVERLLGPAADAPFVERKAVLRFSLGLAYRH